jgi:hypothetical protein
MANRNLRTLLAVVLGVVIFGTFLPAKVMAQDVPKISKEALKAMIGNPDLIIVDVRLGSDWNDSDKKIQGAIRENPRDVQSWSKRYSKEQMLVLY